MDNQRSGTRRHEREESYRKAQYPAESAELARYRQVIGDRAMEVLASTPMSDHDFIANGLYGQELARRLTRESEAGRFFLLDVRRREDFERCHIQGAVRVDFHRWAEPGNLALLPRDRKIVVLSYAGLAAAQVASGLRLLGYDAVVVKTGMNGWKRNDGTGKVLEDIGAAAYPVERKPPEPFAPAPEMEFRQPSGEEFRIIAERAAQVFRRAPRDGSFRHNTIEAGYLHRQLQNGGGDRYFILDLRREEDFEGVGHIGGASQVDFTAAMVEENFSRLPRDRRIVVVCYTGNLAAQLVTVLRLLGFDAVALRYGMIGWTMTPTTRLYLKDIESADYPVVSRAEDN